MQPPDPAQSIVGRHVRRLAARLGRLGEQTGQAMVLTVVAMAVVVGIAAMSIDVSTWYQKHHTAQVAADAASLAAANCLANGTAGTTCTSPTDTTDAKQVAVTIAADNGVTIPTTDVNISGSAVTVTVPNVAPALFAGIAGLHTTTASASAGATFVGAVTNYTTSIATSTNTTTTTTTTPVTGSPLALFGMSSNCSTDGVYMQGGSGTFAGGIFSNGSLYLDPGGSSYESLNFGTGSGCGATLEGGGGTFHNGQPTAAAADVTTFPVPYNTSADPLPTCTNTYTGSGTWSLPNPSSETTPVVYCYPNGTILLTGSAYDDDTFICGSISPQGGGVSLEAENYPTNKLLIYATGTGTAAGLTNGAGVVKGDVEAPNGAVSFDSGGNAFTGLLEGQTVDFSGGGSTITGDGPTTYGSSTQTTTNTTSTVSTTTVPSSTTPGADHLSQ